jgi:FSR family fosmidomycin resistance protein-like MFS transporter
MRARALSALPPTLLLLAAAHLVVDGYANIYAPLLPLLIPRLGLSLAAAGTLAMLFQVAGSVSQLGFGWLADRWRPRAFLMAGPVVAVLALSLIGWAGSTAMLAAALVAGGLGTAAFHPPAAVAAHRLGGRRPGFAMSVYVTGGTLGFSLGPLFFAPLTEWLGLGWTPAMALPGLLVLALFLRRAPEVALEPDAAPVGLRALRPYARPLTLLYAIAVLRTTTGLALTTYVPVLLTGRGMSVAEAGSAFALYLLASGAGGFLGGAAADRFGSRRVIVLSLVACTPFLVAAPLLSGARFVVVIAVGGFFLLATQPVTVTFGQMLAPVSAGTVASLMMGVAWGTAGLAVPVVGLLADRIGLEGALMWVSAVPLLGALCALPLPARVRAPSGPPAAA